MRFTIPAINNDYHDEDYLRVFGFKSLGKNIKVHRSVVIMNPSKISIGNDVTIAPYVVFGDGETVIENGEDIEPFEYFPGKKSAPTPDAEARIKELEAMLEEKHKNDGRPNKAK